MSPNGASLTVAVQQLEDALLSGKFNATATASAELLPDLSSDVGPLELRVLFVALQSFFFAHRQHELHELVDKHFGGLTKLPCQVFILWQLLQLDAGQGKQCRPQIEAYLEHAHQQRQQQQQQQKGKKAGSAAASPAGKASANSNGSSNKGQSSTASLPFMTPSSSFTSLAPSGGSQQHLTGSDAAADAHHHHLSPCVYDYLEDPGKHAHEAALCRLYALDLLCNDLKDCAAAQTFLTSAPSALELLTDAERSDLLAEITAVDAAQAAAAAAARAATPAGKALAAAAAAVSSLKEKLAEAAGAAAGANGAAAAGGASAAAGSAFCTMTGEPNEDEWQQQRQAGGSVGAGAAGTTAGFGAQGQVPEPATPWVLEWAADAAQGLAAWCGIQAAPGGAPAEEAARRQRQQQRAQELLVLLGAGALGYAAYRRRKDVRRVMDKPLQLVQRFAGELASLGLSFNANPTANGFQSAMALGRR